MVHGTLVHGFMFIVLYQHYKVPKKPRQTKNNNCAVILNRLWAPHDDIISICDPIPDTSQAGRSPRGVTEIFDACCFRNRLHHEILPNQWQISSSIKANLPIQSIQSHSLNKWLNSSSTPSWLRRFDMAIRGRIVNRCAAGYAVSDIANGCRSSITVLPKPWNGWETVLPTALSLANQRRHRTCPHRPIGFRRLKARTLVQKSGGVWA